MKPETGQASVEMVALVPVVLLLGLLAWQLALAGHTAWMSAHAARAGARADAVGRDPDAAARSALPRALRRGFEVRRLNRGGVRVRVRIPLLLPGSPSGAGVGASASLGEAR